MAEQPGKPARRTSKEIAGAAIFTAIAIVLNLAIKVPAPYASFLIYEVWEVPIVVAYLVFGLRVSISVSIINLLALQLIFPGALPTGPIYNLMAILFMLLGLAMANKAIPKLRRDLATIVLVATTFGVATRVAGMTVAMQILMPLSPPLGFGIPSGAMPSLLGLIAFFNGSLVIYTVPLAYFIFKAIPSRYKPGQVARSGR